jgi:hypothetical protein
MISGQGRGVTTDDAGLHAANLAALQLLLADAGGWPHEQGDGWVAADAAAATRFFSFTVLTRDGAQPAPTVYSGRSGPTGWVEMDLWGRAAPGETRHPVLMRREPAPLPPADPRVTVARTAEQLREAQVQLAVGLEAPGLHGVLGEGLLDHPVACAYARRPARSPSTTGQRSASTSSARHRLPGAAASGPP